MKEVRDGGVTLLAQYAYDPLSRLTTVTYDNGAQTTHAYELDDDLTQVAQSYGVGSVTFDYLYNLVNQRTDTSVDDNAYLWRPDQDVTNSYLPNALNQYDDVDGVLLTYDGNGNLTGDGVNSYLYDVESRLISATTPQHLADYTYDPFGRRAEKDVDATVTRYVYANDTVIAEYDGLDQLQARYVPGPGIDRPVLMDRGGTLSYYHYDGSGSVIAATDAFGTVAETYAYSPYGESSDPDALGNPYRYTGRRLDAETGLYYYRARYYDPVAGRFLQADPAGLVDGLNLYAYVRNDPLNFVDPFGLDSQYSIGVGGTAAFFVLGAGSSFSIGINVPDTLTDFGGYQLFATTQVNGMAGAGAYLGYGLSVNLSTTDGPLPVVSGSTGWYAEAAIGYGVSVSGSIQGNEDGLTGGSLTPLPRVGEGYGLWVGLGGYASATLATPTVSQIYDGASQIYNRVSQAFNEVTSFLSPPPTSSSGGTYSSALTSFGSSPGK